ncbi:MAG: DNA repair protein RecO [Alphaproteobacteria bacterium]|nr:DNA repair protein RecO [Alphaproteobacteria bacterium]
MTLESTGILIALRPFDERNAVARIFSRDFGVMTGMMRGALNARTNKPLVGQVGSVSWNARLDSALGVFHWDAERNLAAPIMGNTFALQFMNSAFEMVSTLLPERENYTNLYDATLNLLTNLPQCSDMAQEYLNWEIGLIGELGYAFDLGHCSGCGRTTNLNYISPKTARAVCDDCATPYISKLYKMPINLGTTFAFLEKICHDMGANIPISRKILSNKKF